MNKIEYENPLISGEVNEDGTALKTIHVCDEIKMDVDDDFWHTREEYISLTERFAESEREIEILKQDIRVYLREIRVWRDQFYLENDIAKSFEKELREARETSRILDEQLKDAHALIQKLHKRYGDRIYEPN